MITEHETNLPAFGARLRALRRARRMKQAALADELGIDQTTVSRWETGSQFPNPKMRERAVMTLSGAPRADEALSRLVANSVEPVHLIEETTHVCLAASRARFLEWGLSTSDIIGETLWRYATDEIAAAEVALKNGDWWHAYAPDALTFKTTGHVRYILEIHAATLCWERLYLSDGTPVRLCSSLPAYA